MYDEQLVLEAWIEATVYQDAGVRRQLFLDNDRHEVFFFADPLDFDKDDQPVARFWLKDFEGYKPEWKEAIVKLYT